MKIRSAIPRQMGLPRPSATLRLLSIETVEMARPVPYNVIVM